MTPHSTFRSRYTITYSFTVNACEKGLRRNRDRHDHLQLFNKSILAEWRHADVQLANLIIVFLYNERCIHEHSPSCDPFVFVHNHIQLRDRCMFIRWFALYCAFATRRDSEGRLFHLSACEKGSGWQKSLLSLSVCEKRK